MTKTIVFIHGLFQNPKSWNHWAEFFESKGYICHTPAYPFHEGEPSELRKVIHPDLAFVTLAQVIDELVTFIERLPEPPIVIGHSMGGLVAQKLISLKKAVAGICVDSAPPKGIFSFQWSFLKSNVPVITPLKGDSVFVPSVEWFHYAFCNTMTREQATIEYERFVVPESRNIPRGSTGQDGFIDFTKPHAPLLFIAGEKDHIIPASLNKKNFEAYRDKASKRNFREFAGRTHYVCGQEGWEEVARYCADWLQSL